MTADITFRDHGTMLVITAMSDEAKEWVDDHVEVPDYMNMGEDSFATDHRPGRAILEGMAADGFTVRRLGRGWVERTVERDRREAQASRGGQR